MALAFVAVIIQGFFVDTARANIQILHNAFFAAGAIMMLISGLLYVASEGAFIGVSYVFGRMVKSILPFLGKDQETYAEYRERKSEKKTKGPKLAVLLTGVFFFLVSLLFLLIWHNI